MTRAVTLAGYAVIVAAAIALELTSRRRASLPTFGVVVTALTANRTVRLLLTVAWLWLGWHLFVRVDR